MGLAIAGVGAGRKYNPLYLPDVSGLTPTINVATNDLHNQTPVAGDVISVDGSLYNAPFNRDIEDWHGTQENPIWVLGNGATLADRAYEMINCRWVYFADFNLINSSNQGMRIQDCQDIILNNVFVQNTNNNAILVESGGAIPNARIQMHNITLDSWGIDGISIHASAGPEFYENGSGFFINNFTATQPLGQGENSIDWTSGRDLWLFNSNTIDGNLHAAHGVENVYMQNVVHTWTDGGALEDQTIQLRNTDGFVIISHVSGGAGQIDLGQTNNPRPLETPNSVTGFFNTHELRVFDNQLAGGEDNNQVAQGTIVTQQTYNKIGFRSFSEVFNRWPLTA